MSGGYKRLGAHVSLSTVSVMLAAYPIFAFIRGPLRRRGRPLRPGQAGRVLRGVPLSRAGQVCDARLAHRQGGHGQRKRTGNDGVNGWPTLARVDGWPTSSEVGEPMMGTL